MSTRSQRAPEATPQSPWTARALARLGIDTDTQIAADIGLSVSAVASKRRSLAIPRSPRARLEGRAWTREEDRLLGTMPDPELALELGVATTTVERRRLALGRAAFGDRGDSRKPKDLVGARYIDDYRAGVQIARIAQTHGVSPRAVSQALERYRSRVRFPRPKRGTATGQFNAGTSRVRVARSG